MAASLGVQARGNYRDALPEKEVLTEAQTPDRGGGATSLAVAAEEMRPAYVGCRQGPPEPLIEEAHQLRAPRPSLLAAPEPLRSCTG